jgi:hypothetical protein
LPSSFSLSSRQSAFRDQGSLFAFAQTKKPPKILGGFFILFFVFVFVLGLRSGHLQVGQLNLILPLPFVRARLQPCQPTTQHLAALAAEARF